MAFTEALWAIASWVMTQLIFTLMSIQMPAAGRAAGELLRRLHPDRNVPETVLILIVLLACGAIGLSGEITLLATGGTFLLIVVLNTKALFRLW